MKLTLLIGIPGSGKSSYARKNRLRAISLDEIRKELYGDERILGKGSETDRVMREHLARRAAAGRDTTLDATHTSRRRREKMIRLGRRLGYDRIVGIRFQTPLGECLRRNRSRPHPVPDFVLVKMQRALDREPPALEEGFDELTVVE